MKCPIDNTDLIMAERQGIEIDYCPKCRGVWLDRGELDKIIDRSALAHGRDHDDDDRPFVEDRREDRKFYEDRDDDYHRKRRRKSFLGEIFDFD